jgi:hypothetical protein
MIEENIELITTSNLGKKIMLHSIGTELNKWKFKTITPNKETKTETIILTKEIEDWRLKDYE